MKKSLLENISLNFIIKIISYIFSFFTIVYVTRTLLPEIYGRVSFVESVIGYFVMLSALGMPIYGMRTCAEHKNDKKELSKVFNELLSLNILFAIISIIALITAVFFIPALRQNSYLFLIYALGIVFQAIGCEWLYQGLEKFRFIAIATFLVRLIALLSILLFVHSGENMYIYAFFAVIASYGINLIYFINLHKYVDFSFRITVKKEHIKALLIFFMMSCAISVYSNLDITMLGFMTNNYETGLYTISTKIKIFLTTTGGIVCIALWPRVIEYWKTNQHSKFYRLAEKSVTWVCIIQLVLTIFCFIFAKEIILLIGGKSYLGSVTSFRILLLSLIPIGFSNILGNLILIPCGLERKLLKIEIVGAAVNFIANLIFIPLYSGAGAAATTVLSEVIVLISCIYCIKSILKVDFGFLMLYKMPKIVKISVNELIRKIKKKNV